MSDTPDSATIYSHEHDTASGDRPSKEQEAGVRPSKEQPADAPADGAPPATNGTELHRPETGHLPPSHNPENPDLSFPFDTTNVEEGGFTDEYRTVSQQGWVEADTALRPVPSHMLKNPRALQDPEKARELKKYKLVTFIPNDPECPLNYSTWFKWCMYAS